MKKLAIFDMDGTLVDSSITLINAINYVRKNLKLPPMAEEDILSKLNDHSVNPSEYFYNSPNFKAEHEVWFSKYYRETTIRRLDYIEG